MRGSLTVYDQNGHVNVADTPEGRSLWNNILNHAVDYAAKRRKRGDEKGAAKWNSIAATARIRLGR